MNYYHSINRFIFMIPVSLFTSSQCDDGSEVGFQFEIEIVQNMVGDTHPPHVAKTGPRIPEDRSIRTKLCTAVLNCISSEFQEPLNDTCEPSFWPAWEFPVYLDRPETPRAYVHSLYCGTLLRREIRVRAVDNPVNTFIIVIAGFSNWPIGSFYGMNRKGYEFNIRLIDGNPARSAENGKLGDNTLLSSIKNDDLRDLYKQMKLLDWILVCLEAKHHILEHSSVSKPVTQHSKIGYRLLKLYDYENDQMEERVGYQCPMTPVMYVYLEDSKTAGIVLVIKA